MSKKWSIMEEYLVVMDCVHLLWPKAKSNLSNKKDSVLNVTFSHILQVDDSTSVSVNN